VAAANVLDINYFKSFLADKSRRKKMATNFRRFYEAKSRRKSLQQAIIRRSKNRRKCFILAAFLTFPATFGRRKCQKFL
jgi:hypothetical protein